MTGKKPLLGTEALEVAIGDVNVVNNLNLSFNAGQSWGVLGPNGVGKTTLLLTLAGVRPAQGGKVLLKQAPINEIPRKQIAQQLGMLTQNTRFAFDANCLQIALSGRHPHLTTWARESMNDRKMARDALAQVDLQTMESRSCSTLSGGEQRRLALAVTLTQNPDVLLLDEPTNHLDPAHQVDILNQLWKRIQYDQLLQLMALHDINLATCYCTHVLMLFGNGRWQAGLAEELLNEANLTELFGCPIRAVRDQQQTVFAAVGGTNGVG
ncbi:MAG: ABC transporter ATP-binding protein [Pseudomonadota bacterium]